jgi:hypothetical protein
MVSQFYISVFTLLFVKINTFRGARLYIKHVVCGHTRSHKRIVTETKNKYQTRVIRRSVTSETRTTYPSGVPGFFPSWGSCCSILVFCVVLCRSWFALLSFSLGIICPSSIYGFWFALWYIHIFLQKRYYGNLDLSSTCAFCDVQR